MQYMTAVGLHLVHPMNNTHMLNPTVGCSVGYPVGPVTKNVFSPTIRGECLISFRLALLLPTLLFQVRRHSSTLQCHAELRNDQHSVTDWSQFCCKAMLNFFLNCSLKVFLMVGAWQSCENR